MCVNEVIPLKKFRFRLQKYMNLKRQQESIKRLNLTRARSRYIRENESLAEIREELVAAFNRTREARRGSIDLQLISLSEQYIRLQKELQRLQTIVVAEAKAALERRRQELQHVRKEKKLLERLHDHRWAAYCQDVQREEQKVLDEIGTIRFLRT